MGTSRWTIIVAVYLQILWMRFIGSAEPILLKPGQIQAVTLPQLGSQTFNVVGVKPSIHYLLMQVHSQGVPLVLKTTFPPSKESITGTSIGVVTFLRATDTNATWDVGIDYSNSNHTGNATAVVFVQQFDEDAPVPGGCNQVFELETDANIKLSSLPHQTKVWFQLANIGYHRNDSPPSCDSNKNLQYSLYVAYVKEGDHGFEAMFDTLQQMLTPEMIESNAYKVLSMQDGGAQKSLLRVTASEKQGAVFAVVVRDSKNGMAASYVTAVTYSCDFASRTCDFSFGVIESVLTIVCGVVGLFLLLFGHNYLRTGFGIFGFIAVSLVSFSLLMLAGTLTDAASLGIAAVLGLLGALMWLGVWWWLMFPTVSVLLPGMTAGYLVSSTLFFSPFANLSWWASDLNYGLIFACIVLLFPILLLWSPHTLNMVSCGLVGGFCVVMAIAIPLHSSLTYIILTSVRHAAVPGYSGVLVVYPFQTNGVYACFVYSLSHGDEKLSCQLFIADIILAVLWGLLVIGGCILQLYRQRGEAPFPDHHSLQASQAPARQVRHAQLPSASDDERTPLLGQ